MTGLFAGKKFTIMGLDGAGRGLQDARYLLERDAEVIGTDLKMAADLPEAVALAKKFPDLKLVLGEHRLEDFRNRDFVIRAALAPLESPYLAEAKKNGVSVVSDETLFLLNAPKIKTIGVTGTRGKTTVTSMIYEILKNSFSKKVFLGGNVQNTATLPLLDKVKAGDSIVMELDSWKLQSFADNKISPHIAVFTTFFPDHLNYYKGKDAMKRYFEDKTSVFKNQKKGDLLIVGPQVAPLIHRQKIVAPKLPVDWQLKVLGEHNRDNAALALEAARALGIPDKVSKEALENFSGVPGRLEYLGNKNGVDYYNDTTATTPEGVMAALKAINRPGRIILLAGGADKGLEYGPLVKEFKKNLKVLVLFKGEASEKIRKVKIKNEKLKIVDNVGSMKEAFEAAKKFSIAGDVILLSPGAASFGIFKNEYDRGGQFAKLFNMM